MTGCIHRTQGGRKRLAASADGHDTARRSVRSTTCIGEIAQRAGIAIALQVDGVETGTPERIGHRRRIVGGINEAGVILIAGNCRSRARRACLRPRAQGSRRSERPPAISRVMLAPNRSHPLVSMRAFDCTRLLPSQGSCSCVAGSSCWLRPCRSDRCRHERPGPRA